tara:strand:- start:485 stop:799 length:315 start_codon:yes stop_codon:yes gene_type:complete
MGYIKKGEIMKNLVKLLTLSFFAMFAASDIEASTYGYVNTYNNAFTGTTTTYGSIGNSSIHLNTYNNAFTGGTTTYGHIGSSSVYSTTYNNAFTGTTSTYMYID